MNEQRRQVLRMLSEGKITAEEAERLIDALDREQSEPPPGAAPRPKTRPKYLRVVVDAADGSSAGGDGASRVNIRIPLQLLRAGVRLASLLPPRALAKVNEELNRSGVPIDLGELKPQHLEDLVDHLDEVTVDVDDPEAKVRVYCE
ncbi:hypothetical protein AB0L74_30710 [Streptomyces sp. NPDC052020]|uniref:SHOCT-like domain-containing protein n=1 Tax=Streptomyces sp. NPDC052020 TaxID=3155677 RepID=UPI0034418BF4